MIERGKFISLSGIDGSGKSTHLQWLADNLKELGKDVIVTHEPGGTPLGEKLRELLLHDMMSIKTEALLMFASRNEHILNVIKPALERGAWVISDRFTDCSFAFQGGGRCLDIEFLNTLEKLVHYDLQPDLTFLFDLPVEVAQARITNRELDKFELEQSEFHQRVRGMYLQRAIMSNDRIHIIDSEQSIENIRIDLLKTLIEKFNLT
ncbi:MAG: Thymidylate kinase [uncultured bacterium]|nr:MAG: Thymidylate kinase [uncultured bacterium]